MGWRQTVLTYQNNYCSAVNFQNMMKNYLCKFFLVFDLHYQLKQLQTRMGSTIMQLFYYQINVWYSLVPSSHLEHCLCLFSGLQAKHQKGRRRLRQLRGQQNVPGFTWTIVTEIETGSQSLKKASNIYCSMLNRNHAYKLHCVCCLPMFINFILWCLIVNTSFTSYHWGAFCHFQPSTRCLRILLARQKLQSINWG